MAAGNWKIFTGWKSNPLMGNLPWVIAFDGGSCKFSLCSFKHLKGLCSSQSYSPGIIWSELSGLIQY